MLIKIIVKLLIFPVAYMVGIFLYQSEYFPKGRFFQNWHSSGWQWVLPDFLGRILFGRNKGIPWPTSPFARIGRNIEFDPYDLDNFQSPGTYFQTWDAKIVIGKGTDIAQNCGLITSNHNVYDLSLRGKVGNIVIGRWCWIGMNSIILPGVCLGDHTIVGAGSVVTHSFPEGFCVIAGNPAKIIKMLSPERFCEEENR